MLNITATECQGGERGRSSRRSPFWTTVVISEVGPAPAVETVSLALAASTLTSETESAITEIDMVCCVRRTSGEIVCVKSIF